MYKWARAQFGGCSSTTNALSETGQMADCCQNLTLGALNSRSALPVLVGALFKKSGLFLNTPRTLHVCIFGCMCVCTYVLGMYVCIYVCMYEFMHCVGMCVFMYVCTCVCMYYACVYVCMYVLCVCICVYIRTYVSSIGPRVFIKYRHQSEPLFKILQKHLNTSRSIMWVLRFRQHFSWGLFCSFGVRNCITGWADCEVSMQRSVDEADVQTQFVINIQWTAIHWQ
jgi:hypothetical protein